jgi:hypothetical protein
VPKPPLVLCSSGEEAGAALQPKEGGKVVLLISYDLNRYERPAAYREVAAAIERVTTDFRRPLASQWLVATNGTPREWREYLLQFMDSDDFLFICQVVRGRDGWLPREVWEWLEDHGVPY